MLITDKNQLKNYESTRRVWQGIPGIARTVCGTTFISGYSGTTKEGYGNFAFLLRSKDDANFGEPIAAAFKEGDFRCFDPVVWIDPLRRLWFIWNVMPDGEVWASICERPDEEKLEWGEEFCIGRGVMMNKPLVLTSGEWLFPIAVWAKEIRVTPEFGLSVKAESGAFVYKTSDNGKSFFRTGGVSVRGRSFDEHMIVELKNGVLQMFVRTHYGIGVSCSYDRGKTWTTGADSRLGGPCSRFHVKRLRSGRLLLVNHYKFEGRNNLTAFLSEDEGKTYPYTLLLDERSNVSYPDVAEDDDGEIYIVYDRERGGFKSSLREAYADARELLTAKITEEDIINGALKTEGSFLKRAVSKLDRLAKDIPDPFIATKEDDQTIARRLLEEKEDVINALFELYPICCSDFRNFDGKKLDGMITQFHKSGDTSAELLEKIIRFLRQVPCEKSSVAPIIEQTKRYIDERFGEELSLAQIAESMHISLYYLSHVFKSETGITPMEYRNEMRLTQAKKLLLQTDYGITEIAYMTGFSDSSYFSKYFRKTEKVSPTMYRKYHK